MISQTAEALEIVAKTIAGGGVIAFRTDTFYGLGADPFNANAIGKVKELKGREDRKPILIVISDLDQVARFISETSPGFNKLAKVFWPGPLTLIGKANLSVPQEITAGTGTVGLRLPDDESVSELVRTCGGALTATSANPANLAPARNAQTVDDYFGAAVDLIVDGGNSNIDRPSTVVDVSGAEPKLIRDGVIAWSAIENQLAV